MGLRGYYGRFVQGYGSIAWPLTELKKDGFCWNDDAEEAFEKLKLAMTIVSVLAHPDLTKLFVIDVDASGFRLAAALMQE